ncbi:MAG: TIGR02147 family protein [Fibrobacterales bacterium]
MTHYLEALIHYDLAKCDSQKQYYRDQMLYLKPSILSYNLERNHTAILENWHSSVLRELVPLIDFDENYTYLGSLLTPPLPAKQAKETVTLLLEHGFITRTEGELGVTYSQTDTFLETPPNLPKSLAIRNHQRKTIALGAEAIERFPKTNRNIIGATFSTNEKGTEAMNKLINEFQRKMVKIVSENDSGCNRVYQTNIQFFPLSKKIDE